jgi:aspartokinase
MRQMSFYFDYECAISLDDKNFLQNSVQLSCTNCVCKTSKHKPIKYDFCGQQANMNSVDFDVSMSKNEEMKNNFDELFNETKERFKVYLEEYKGFSSLDPFIILI